MPTFALKKLITREFFDILHDVINDFILVHFMKTLRNVSRTCAVAGVLMFDTN